METLVLVRHGETHWNASGLSQGHKDVPLSENGRRQIELLRESLSGVAFDRSFCSPLQRARQTAELLGADPDVLDDLIEIDRGHWEGHDAAEIQRRWGKLHKQWYDDPAGLAMPGGEGFDELWERAGRVLARLENEPGIVLACAHKAVNRVLLARVLDRPTRGVWQIPQPQAACSILHRDGGGWRTERLGDVSHLPEELRSSS